MTVSKHGRNAGSAHPKWSWRKLTASSERGSAFDDPVTNSVFVLIVAIILGLCGISMPVTGLAGPIDSNVVQFSDATPRIELKPALLPYHAASDVEPDGSRWHIMTVANQLTRPVTRILVAEEPPDAALRLFPHRARPAIKQVASSDPDVVAEPAQAYGRHAFRVFVPAARTVAIAVRISDADAKPLVAAWTEGALSAHNRQLAVFFAAVAGLIAASLAITTGLAAMTGHPAPRWGAITLLAVFLSRLAASGVFDSIGAANVGGPYGLSATLAGLSVAAGIRLTDTIAPFENVFASAMRWQKWTLSVLVGVSLLAFVGVPGAMLATESASVVVAAVVVVYLVYCGRRGGQAARVAAPAALVFALVATAGALVALGGFSDTPAAPGVIGGFASAGAVLLALAISAGEGIAILPARRSSPSSSGQLDSFEEQDDNSGRGDLASEAIGASQQGIFDYDIESGRVRLSTDVAAMLGLRPAKTQLPFAEWLARIHPEDCEVFSSAVDDFRAHPGLAFRVEFRLPSSTGQFPWLELRATMIGEGMRARRCLGLVADITSRKEAEPKAAPRSGLNVLPNRTAFLVELERLKPHLASQAVALVDIDRFKSVHASLGDDGGDAVLSEFAGRLSEAFLQPQIYRMGGDCFALAFPAGAAQMETFASTLSEALKAPFIWAGREVYVTASAGVARGGTASDPAALVKQAECSLADAKQRGGGSTCLYAPDEPQSAREDSVVLETELRQALKNDELEVVYQPIVRLGDATLAGFEALLRWTHPVKGLVEPSGFIEHSEQTGSIVELGGFALRQATGELARWQRHFPLDPPLFVNVNLSRRQLQDDGFEPLFVELLSGVVISPGTLKLELTESAVTYADDTVARLRRLKAAGAGLAIDDFGTGVSSLSQLEGLPFDTLKIDKSFLASREEAKSAQGSSILRSIVQLAHQLNLAVVTEGVETARDAEWLKDIGCEFGQGYFFSPPLSRDEVLAFIARHHGHPGAPQSVNGPSSVTGVDGKSGDVNSQLA